jgi:hypothetical protein
MGGLNKSGDGFNRRKRTVTKKILKELGRVFNVALPRILRWLALGQGESGEHIPWKSVTDEQRSLSASQPKVDGECTLKTRPNTLLLLHMQYLGIVFAFLMAVMVLVIATVVAAAVGRWKRAVPYLVSGTIGAALGFVMFTVISVLALWGVAWCLHQTALPDGLRKILNPCLGYALAFGPVIISPLGFIFGFVAGAKRVSRGANRIKNQKP